MGVTNIMCVTVKYLFLQQPPHYTQLHHLILIGCDDPGQAAGQQHANQLKDKTNSLVYKKMDNPLVVK